MKITMYNKNQSPNLAAIIEINGEIFKETDHNLNYFELKNKYYEKRKIANNNRHTSIA